MKNYLVTYYARLDALTQMSDSTPEQREEGMKMWTDWAAKAEGHVVNLGNPLAYGKRIAVGGDTSDSTKQLCGYSIMQGENMDEILKLLNDHPHNSGWEQSCEIEVHEMLEM